MDRRIYEIACAQFSGLETEKTPEDIAKEFSQVCQAFIKEILDVSSHGVVSHGREGSATNKTTEMHVCPTAEPVSKPQQSNMGIHDSISSPRAIDQHPAKKAIQSEDYLSLQLASDTSTQPPASSIYTQASSAPLGVKRLTLHPKKRLLAPALPNAFKNDQKACPAPTRSTRSPSPPTEFHENMYYSIHCLEGGVGKGTIDSEAIHQSASASLLPSEDLSNFWDAPLNTGQDTISCWDSNAIFCPMCGALGTCYC